MWGPARVFSVGGRTATSDPPKAQKTSNFLNNFPEFPPPFFVFLFRGVVLFSPGFRFLFGANVVLVNVVQRMNPYGNTAFFPLFTFPVNLLFYCPSCEKVPL